MKHVLFILLVGSSLYGIERQDWPKYLAEQEAKLMVSKKKKELVVIARLKHDKVIEPALLIQRGDILINLTINNNSQPHVAKLDISE